jgi:hypothetical protein
MASVNFSNAPSIDASSVAIFRAIADAHGGLARSNRFVVRIEPQGPLLIQLGPIDIVRDLQFLTELAEIPGRGFQNIDLRYYGPSFKLPFQTSYEDLNLGFICRAKGMEREFFDDWLQLINPCNTWDFNYRDDYRAKIEIFHLTDTETISDGNPSILGFQDSSENNAIYKATIHNAYPIIINQQPLLWQDDQFMKLTVGFTYTHWTREGLDPTGTVPNNGNLVAGRDSQNVTLGI